MEFVNPVGGQHGLSGLPGASVQCLVKKELGKGEECVTELGLAQTREQFKPNLVWNRTAAQWKVVGRSGGAGSRVQSHVKLEVKKGKEHAPTHFHNVGLLVKAMKKILPFATLKLSVRLMAGGPAGETGVPVKALVLMKGKSPQTNSVKGCAPTPLRP